MTAVRRSAIALLFTGPRRRANDVDMVAIAAVAKKARDLLCFFFPPLHHFLRRRRRRHRRRHHHDDGTDYVRICGDFKTGESYPCCGYGGPAQLYSRVSILVLKTLSSGSFREALVPCAWDSFCEMSC